MNHYVYRITNIKLGKHYYGLRSSLLLPSQDLGKFYFSSSTDKAFISEQKTDSKNFKYKIIKTFNCREKAVELEIFLHKKFDVGINESFYNKRRQTTTGFDAHGFKHTEESIDKISRAGRRICRQETKDKISNTLKGHSVSEETRNKISKANSNRIQSQETKDKRAKALMGQKRIQKTKDKISKAMKGKPQEKVICPHCKKEGGASNMKRYHFNNCKKLEFL